MNFITKSIIKGHQFHASTFVDDYTNNPKYQGGYIFMRLLVIKSINALKKLAEI